MNNEVSLVRRIMKQKNCENIIFYMITSLNFHNYEKSLIKNHMFEEKYDKEIIFNF